MTKIQSLFATAQFNLNNTRFGMQNDDKTTSENFIMYSDDYVEAVIKMFYKQLQTQKMYIKQDMVCRQLVLLRGLLFYIIIFTIQTYNLVGRGFKSN